MRRRRIKRARTPLRLGVARSTPLGGERMGAITAGLATIKPRKIAWWSGPDILTYEPPKCEHATLVARRVARGVVELTIRGSEHAALAFIAESHRRATRDLDALRMFPNG